MLQLGSLILAPFPEDSGPGDLSRYHQLRLFHGSVISSGGVFCRIRWPSEQLNCGSWVRVNS